jgi:hypothetical protein
MLHASVLLMRLLTALLLIPALLFCPYLCRTESGCGCCSLTTSVQQAERVCAHGCCTRPAERADKDSPAPRSPQNPSPHACLCKGALAAEHIDLGLQLQLQWLVIAVPASAADAAQPAMLHAGPPQADWSPSGTDLRIVCCSWLC